ncbi:MAG: glycosyltransferase family 9 protein [Gammaproteobacteria bacterium]|jgi:heptosyltransferase I
MPTPLPDSPESLCVLRLSAVGDVCHTLPVVRTLQKHLPRTRITWVIGALEATLLGDIEGVEFITFNKKDGLAGYRRLRRQLAGRHFDVLLQMQVALRASLAALCIPATVRVGFDRARARDFQWLFTNRRIAPGGHEHVMDGLFGFARALGISERELRWDIPLSEADRAFAAEHVPADQPKLIISPCSSQRARNFRNWAAEHYAAVADHAQARWGMPTLVTGGPSELERDYARRISELASAPITDLVGRTSLKQLAALLERARVLVSPDSGPVHIATAMGTPVIGLYATSNPDRTGPCLGREWIVNRYPDNLREFLHTDVDSVRWGTRVRHPEAMERIRVDEVIERLDRLMETSGAPAP